MRIAVWKTGHIIADTVALAIESLDHKGCKIWYCDTNIDDIPNVIRNADVDCHIGYGILRGMDKVFRECDRQRKPWFNIDRGYFNPGHYDGYYRVSLCGTQQTIGLEQLEPDYDRFARFNCEISSLNHEISNGHTLIVPPTEPVVNFFNVEYYKYAWGYPEIIEKYGNNCILRKKDTNIPIEEHLKNCSQIITFNSSIGWEALRRGIPVISDPNHSIVGAFQKLVDKPLHLDDNARHKLFGIMGDLELTLNEIREGLICPLIEKLLSLKK